MNFWYTEGFSIRFHWKIKKSKMSLVPTSIETSKKSASTENVSFKKIITHIRPFRIMPARSTIRYLTDITFLHTDRFKITLTIGIIHNISIFDAIYSTGLSNVETITRTLTPRTDKPITKITFIGCCTLFCRIWSQANVTPINVWNRTITKY